MKKNKSNVISKNQSVQRIFFKESGDSFGTLCILCRQAIQDKRQHNRSEKINWNLEAQ